LALVVFVNLSWYPDFNVKTIYIIFVFAKIYEKERSAIGGISGRADSFKFKG
jgi:hypothetical protein